MHSGPLSDEYPFKYVFRFVMMNSTHVDFMGPYTNDGNFLCSYFSIILENLCFLSLCREQHLFSKIFRNGYIPCIWVPKLVHSDNGKQFVSEMFTSFLGRYGTNHIRTVFYSPQANNGERGKPVGVTNDTCLYW